MHYKLPDLIVRHQSISNPNYESWNLTPFTYLGGSKIRRIGNWNSKLKQLPIATDRINIIKAIKEHVIKILDAGISYNSVRTFLNSLKFFFQYVDDHNKPFGTPNEIEKALYDYAEYKFTCYSNKKIKMSTAYAYLGYAGTIFNGAIDNVNFDLRYTRLIKTTNSKRAISRESEKVLINDAAALARFCFDICNNFKPETLDSKILPIEVSVRNKTLKKKVNLTPYKKRPATTIHDFFYTIASQAFNNRVSAELMIFLGMTIQNISPTHNLRLKRFNFKPLGENYEVREYKHRRGGEALFKIPKPYKPYFEKYLKFINKYAPESEWLFPFLEMGIGYKKRNEYSINNFKRLCIRYKIPWTPQSNFRSIGENILMRLCSSEQAAADYANHGVATFRQSYELPSLQRAMVEVGNFWNENDPLTHGTPKVSLFNAPCSGVPEEISNSTNKLPKPDCTTPTGCIGCKNYRDEESFDYIWNLQSFKYLKIIESSSYRTSEEKASNIAIDWVNLKINWFKNSNKSEYQKWIKESQMRIEEGDYHPSWSKKIEKYES